VSGKRSFAIPSGADCATSCGLSLID